MRTDPVEIGPDTRLLLIVSDRVDASASVRSRSREVLRWAGHDPLESAPRHAGERIFHGDPAAADTYNWITEAQAVSIVLDLADADLRHRVAGTLRALRPDAALLLLRGTEEDKAGDGTVVRSGALRDVLRVDVEEELERLEAERRVWCLRDFARGVDTLPIVLHPDPDPDALSSALAIRVLLGRDSHDAPVVTLRTMTRPENCRMAELLNLDVVQVSAAELNRYDRVVAVDTQPHNAGARGGAGWAVVDHHPLESGLTIGLRDVRPDYGATATILSEYLRAAPDRTVSAPLATALLYGIRTDTDALTRGVGPPDVAAYAWIQERVDPMLLRLIERPAYSRTLVRRFGAAVAGVVVGEDVAAVWSGALDGDDAHMLSELADLCLGVEGASWGVAGALIEEDLVLAIRHLGPGPGAGAVAKRLVAGAGRGGGHATMARAVLPPPPAARGSDAGAEAMGAWIVERIRSALAALREQNSQVSAGST
ncbi:MAG: hypothetical protein WEA24_17390 [Gemmatimonadota bacterium]